MVVAVAAEAAVAVIIINRTQCFFPMAIAIFIGTSTSAQCIQPRDGALGIYLQQKSPNFVGVEIGETLYIDRDQTIGSCGVLQGLR